MMNSKNFNSGINHNVNLYPAFGERLNNREVFIVKNLFELRLKDDSNSFFKIHLRIPGNGGELKNKNSSFLSFEKPNASLTISSNEFYTDVFSCYFSENYLKLSPSSNYLIKSVVSGLEKNSTIELSECQQNFIKSLFERMMDIQSTSYHFQDEFLRNCIQIIIHEVIKSESSISKPNTKINAASRISDDFFKLLDDQFPVDLNRPLELRSAQDFADKLSIHVNHLSRSLKESTGLTTKNLINDRIVVEAKKILKYTKWNISEAAYALGFENSSYFNSFLRRLTSKNPTEIRSELLENKSYLFDYQN